MSNQLTDVERIRRAIEKCHHPEFDAADIEPLTRSVAKPLQVKYSSIAIEQIINTHGLAERLAKKNVRNGPKGRYRKWGTGECDCS